MKVFAKTRGPRRAWCPFCFAFLRRRVRGWLSRPAAPAAPGPPAQAAAPGSGRPLPPREKRGARVGVPLGDTPVAGPFLHAPRLPRQGGGDCRSPGWNGKGASHVRPGGELRPPRNATLQRRSLTRRPWRCPGAGGGWREGTGREAIPELGRPAAAARGFCKAADQLHLHHLRACWTRTSLASPRSH